MIIAVPAKTPPTIPVLLPTVAMVILLVLHAPPLVPSYKMDVLPAHKLSMPDIIVGMGLIVTVVLAGQYPAKLYEIVAVPAASPVIVPEVLPTVATLVLELLHTPPPARGISVAVEEAQIVVVPVTPSAGNPVT